MVRIILSKGDEKSPLDIGTKSPLGDEMSLNRNLCQ